MNTWISFTQKRDSTKLLIEEPSGLELLREHPFCKEDILVPWYHISAAFNSTMWVCVLSTVLVGLFLYCRKILTYLSYFCLVFPAYFSFSKFWLDFFSWAYHNTLAQNPQNGHSVESLLSLTPIQALQGGWCLLTLFKSQSHLSPMYSPTCLRWCAREGMFYLAGCIWGFSLQRSSQLPPIESLLKRCCCCSKE